MTASSYCVSLFVLSEVTVGVQMFNSPTQIAKGILSPIK